MRDFEMSAAFGRAWSKLDPNERAALIADVDLVRDDMREGARAALNASFTDAALELRRRIGGVMNLRSYVGCLMVGHARRAAQGGAS